MARFDCATWRPLPEHGKQPAIRPTQVIVHTAVDAPGATNLHGYFARADITLESHFWSPLNLPLEQFMDTEERADANYLANRRPDGTGAISVETEDEGNPEGVPWSEKQLRDLTAIGVEAHRRHGIPVRKCRTPDDPGFGWHTMFGAPSDWTNAPGKTCPGSTRIAQFDGVLARIQAAVTPPIQPSEEDDMLQIVVGNIVYLLGPGPVITSLDGLGEVHNQLMRQGVKVVTGSQAKTLFDRYKTAAG